MKKTVSLGHILLFLIVSVGFAGCTGSDPIVGTWKESTLGANVVFNADHTVTLNMMGVTIPAKWDNLGNGEYTITGTVGTSVGHSYTFRLLTDGKTMTSGSGSNLEVYTKVS